MNAAHHITINLPAFSELVRGRSVKYSLGRGEAVEIRLAPMTAREMVMMILDDDPPQAAEFLSRRYPKSHK